MFTNHRLNSREQGESLIQADGRPIASFGWMVGDPEVIAPLSQRLPLICLKHNVAIWPRYASADRCPSTEGLIKSRTFPQRLKPHCRQATCGTAEAVPLTKPDLIRGSLTGLALIEATVRSLSALAIYHSSSSFSSSKYLLPRVGQRSSPDRQKPSKHS